MKSLKIVRIDGKRLTLSKANLNQLASIASLGIDLKNMTGEGIGEAAPLMIEIVKECLHSRKYEVSDGTAIEWITENLDLDALTDEAEKRVNERFEENGLDDQDGTYYDEQLEEELNRLASEKMPQTVFLGDMDVQLLADLFAQTMPKKKAMKQLKKKKGD